MKKKILLVITSLLAIIIIIPLGVVAVQLSLKGKPNVGRNKPPLMNVDNEMEIDFDSYIEDGNLLFDDEKKDFCLGYLNNFKNEIVSANDNPQVSERINNKNTLINNYKKYVNSLYNKIMTEEEYYTHYYNLMDIISELVLLEPEDTPEEKFEINLNRLLLKMEEDLYYSEIHGEFYINAYNINVPMLKQSIADFTSLQNKFCSKKINFEQAQNEYSVLIKNVKKSSPSAFEYSLSIFNE